MPVATNGSVPKPVVKSSTITSISSKKSKKDKSKKLTKADIGLPSDFKHLSHVGWDPNQGFALDNVDPNLLKFFAKVRNTFLRQFMSVVLNNLLTGFPGWHIREPFKRQSYTRFHLRLHRQTWRQGSSDPGNIQSSTICWTILSSPGSG